jgi:Ca2+-binding RTX toxin-like protein
MAAFMHAISTGTVSGSGVTIPGIPGNPDFLDITESISGTVTLDISHYEYVGGAYYLVESSSTFQGTAGLSGWDVDEFNWSGSASVDPNHSGGAFGYADGTASVFEANLIISHNGVYDQNSTFVWLVLDLTIGAGDSLTVTGAHIEGYGDDIALSFSFAPFSAGTIDGTPGNDTLNGTGGDDVINGGAGNDFITAGDGNDTVSGGDGLDTILGGSGRDSIDGGAGSDSIDGGIGNDILYANDGDDTVTGGSGNDSLIGGSGQGDDRYTGGTGTDTLRYSSATHAVTANLKTGRGSGVDIGNDTVASIENLIGGQAVDGLTGSAGANKIDGQAGADLIKGLGGNDTLTGGGGSDKIYGGAGNDRLDGGAAGDRFYFVEAPSAGNADTILNFASGSDKICLDDVVFGQLRTLGTLASSNFALGAAADSDDYLVFVAGTGKLYYDADGSGAALPVLIATLTGGASLAASDITVI